MAIFLAILKFIGIFLLTVLILAVLVCVAVLFVPVRYEVTCKRVSTFRVGYRVSWFLRAIQLRKEMAEEGHRIYLFGIDIRRYKNLFRKKKERVYEDKKVTESRVNLVDDFYEEAEKKEEKERQKDETYRSQIETDYEDEKEQTKEKVSGKHKKSFSFEKISSIITFIRDYENKKGFKKIKKELASLLRYLMPDKVEGRISFGTGDPCTTGWVLGGISMFPVAYTEGLTIHPDFEEKVFDADGMIKGKARVIYFLRLILRGYMDEDIKKCITKALKLI